VISLVTAGGGFLLAVLWFDLMFDVQVLRHRETPLPEGVLASIAAYYRRVTTEARLMSRLVALVMLGTIVATASEIPRGDTSKPVAWASFALVGAAVAVATLHTFPSAVRLGARTDPVEVQSRLAKSICRDHLLCLAAIGLLLALQLRAAA
jgi:hypothetical protein